MSKRTSTQAFQTETLILSDLDHQGQAEQFFDWFHRLPPGKSLESAFSEWGDSKDFWSADRTAIFTHVQRLLLDRRETSP